MVSISNSMILNDIWFTSEKKVSYLGKLCDNMFGNSSAIVFSPEEVVCRSWFKDAYDHCSRYLNRPIEEPKLTNWLKERLLQFVFPGSKDSLSIEEGHSEIFLDDSEDVLDHGRLDDPQMLTKYSCKSIFAEVVNDYLDLVTVYEERLQAYDLMVNIIFLFIGNIFLITSFASLYLLISKFKARNSRRSINHFISYSGCTNYSSPRAILGNGEMVKQKPIFKFKIYKESSLYDLILATIKNDQNVLQNMHSCGDGNSSLADLEYCYFLFEVISSSEAALEVKESLHLTFGKPPIAPDAPLSPVVAEPSPPVARGLYESAERRSGYLEREFGSRRNLSPKPSSPTNERERRQQLQQQQLLMQQQPQRGSAALLRKPFNPNYNATKPPNSRNISSRVFGTRSSMDPLIHG